MLTIENKQDRFARLQAMGPDGSLDEFTKKMVRNFIASRHLQTISSDVDYHHFPVISFRNHKQLVYN